ncbi:ROK family transcriptional regulator [Brevibacillus massiliensis]|uniref:ROK family transcriptional regulator n=1 Tax=Brevibacillus massiliensis TaxID=1118054 RepID=UPI0002E03830|nr:ROK family transcriptional regulator [Brevibacillus massiliensis]
MLGRGRTGNAKFVKQINRQGILYQLKKRGQMSRADLAKHTELSRPCVSALVDELIQEGLIHEVGVGESKGGRRPILLEYNSQAQLVVGAVFEGSMLHMAIADLHGDLLARYHTRLVQPTDGETATQSLEAGLAALLAETGFEKDRLLGMGLGLPGITRKRNGTVSYAPSTGWMGLPVQQEMEARLGVPVTIDNDVNMMTLGEYYRGVGKGVSNLVYMYVGTGIGAGIVIDGQFYRGSTEAAGEIGYMMIGPVRKCSPGGYGAFEQNYAVPGVMDKAMAILPETDPAVSVVKQLVQAAGTNAAARQLLEDVYQHWALGMANLVSVLDPELLVLSGEMIHIGKAGKNRMEELLRQWVPVVPQITFATLGEQAGLVGAVFSVLEPFPKQVT